MEATGSVSESFMDRISIEVAPENSQVTGCHPRCSRSLEHERSREECASDLHIISSQGLPTKFRETQTSGG